MEVPIILATDTTENWERSTTVLGRGELAVEIIRRQDGGSKEIVHLLLGDGKPVSPNMERLRVRPEIIAGLDGTLDALRHDIDTRATHTDDTLSGDGTQGNPLSVQAGAFEGITSRAVFTADGHLSSFKPPQNFMFSRLSIVMVNGLGQEPGADYTLSEEDKAIIFTDVPKAGDIITVFYTRTGDNDETEASPD